MPILALDVACDDAGPHTLAMQTQRLLHMTTGLVGFRTDQGIFGHLAPEFGHLVLRRQLGHLFGQLDGFVPGFFQLIDFQQLLQRFFSAGTFGKALENFFGPIEQAGLQVIDTQLEQGLFLQGLGQILTIHQVLVDAQRPL